MKTTPLRSSLLRTTVLAAILAGAALISAEWAKSDGRAPDPAARLAQADPPAPAGDVPGLRGR